MPETVLTLTGAFLLGSILAGVSELIDAREADSKRKENLKMAIVLSQEEYCRPCLSHVTGSCNIILTDDELLRFGCSDRKTLTPEEITTTKGIEALSNCGWKDPDKKPKPPRRIRT